MGIHSPGSVIAGRYEVVRELARGAMGIVYLARHKLSRKEVALKVLDPRTSTSEVAMARFEREVSVRAETKHEGIVDVLDAGIAEDGSPYIAMELLEGESLRDRLNRLTDVGQKLALVAALLDPLEAAHAKAFVHRDLKPENAFVVRRPDGSDLVKILDFGIARQLEGRAATQTATAMGTPHYMAPEQAMSARAATPAADVWSVGVMLYEVVAGSPPFEGETPHAVILAAVSAPHRPLAQVAPGTSPALAALVDRCLAKRPEDRPRDASELRAALASALSTAPVAPTKEPPSTGVATVAMVAVPHLGVGPAPVQPPPNAPASTGTVAMDAQPLPHGSTGTVAMEVVREGSIAAARASGPTLGRASAAASSRAAEGTFGPTVAPSRPSESDAASRWLAPGIVGGIVLVVVVVAAIAGVGPFARDATQSRRETAAAGVGAAPRVTDPTRGSFEEGLAAARAITRSQAAQFAPVTRVGRVQTTTGTDVVRVGDRCFVHIRWVETLPNNCKAIVRCGDHVLYGSGSSGINACTLAGAELRSGRDMGGVATDGDADFSMDLWARSVTVRDFEPDYSIEIILDP